MLVRDFINDSLYNPNYGFFAKQPISFNNKEKECEGDEDYIRLMSTIARTHGGVQSPHSYSSTELFQPWFAHAIAKYMVVEYKLSLYPHKDLIIYELNGGKGRLMPYILDYIKQHEPSVYQRTQYNLIELPHTAHQHIPEYDCPMTRFEQSIFDWNKLVTEQCFILGSEVLTRLGHDMIQYQGMTPHQGLVCIDSQGHYHQLFEPVGSDPLINRYLGFRKKLKTPSPNRTWDRFKRLSLSSNINDTYEFVPTKLFQLLDILRSYFPEHRLILTDYSSLPHAIEGLNAPLVQTPYKDRMVRCKTFRLPPGWYDIMFPTNFELLKETYHLMCHKRVKVLNLETFVERYEKTRKRASNMKVFLT
ncbi:hypothetical protein RO3G_08418 [Rhizopus delemar RA 99-880]|uniref:Protein arginine methyltransferase NDUFAF7 n=1 Tax=Rhizopus delemar (strain RA 99-880 / ATCC MYA-4621 / FGSC 9543 / NRRL 43880) TaxID=246409 RepID=I1C5I3_RHIO9|nr:hypothetical protein RO3G_08418 [Rhizopus delemar RA 99-880]|eukprot:EIE83713.1 hypothetical protein RO3G_08418 [Rhizopus delemar RA 99-880]